jgi:hypothetical protein
MDVNRRTPFVSLRVHSRFLFLRVPSRLESVLDRSNFDVFIIGGYFPLAGANILLFAIYACPGGPRLLGSLIAGYAMAKVRSWLHIVVFAAVITVTIYVIIDLEFPRIGFIRLTATDRLLVELRRKMG